MTTGRWATCTNAPSCRKTRTSSILAIFKAGIRVAPRLRELDDLTTSLEAFADVAELPSGFAVRVRDAATALGDAEKTLKSATERRDRLQVRFDELAVSPELAAAEPRIRDNSELSIHVSKARSDRAKRQIEIDQGEAQLVSLRRMLAIPADADLASIMPARESTEALRTLLAAATERRPTQAAARERAAEIAEAIQATKAQLAELESGGFDTALETSSSQFSGIATQKAGIDARRRSLDEDLRRITDGVAHLGFATIEELQAFACPTPDLIRAEQAARDTLETQRTEQERIRRQASRDIATSNSDITALQATGTIASDDAVRDARVSRNLQWSPIRAAFVAGTPLGTEPERIQFADSYEETLDGADALADRRAEEAERAASLVLAQRRVADAMRLLQSTEEELVALSRDLENRIAAFGEAFSDANARYSNLASLLAFTERRMQIIEQAAETRSKEEALAVDAAVLEPTIELAVAAERRLGIVPAAEFSTRMQALVAAHGRHEQRHADHRRLSIEADALRLQAATVEAALDRMDAEETAFHKEWRPALALLCAPETLSLVEAGELLSEWASARGVLSAIAQTRQRIRCGARHAGRHSVEARCGGAGGGDRGFAG